MTDTYATDAVSLAHFAGRFCYAEPFIAAESMARARRLCGSDTLDLRDLAILKERLNDQIKTTVFEYRRNGATWDEIGDDLGMSRQAAHKRFGP